MSLSEFFESNYLTACDMQRDIEKDAQMKNMLRKRNIDYALVKSWMHDYSLFQGITSSNRTKIVETYASLVFEVTEQVDTPNREQIQIMFHEILSAFYKSVP